MFKNASHAPSFKVIVSRYKSSRSFLNRGGPKQNRYLLGLGAPVLYMLPLLPLADKHERFRLRKPRDRLALVQILLTCIPSQIICDGDPKILDTFDIFEDCSLQSIWSMDLLDSFLVIYIILHLTGWNLIHHFLDQYPSWSISFWSFDVSSVSLISR